MGSIRSKIQIGDVLKVREWDDMMREFGGNESYIRCPTHIFPCRMRYLCSQIFTVKSISRTPSGATIYLSEEGCELEEGVNSGGYWYITKHMLEEYVDNTPEFFESDLINILNTI